MPAYAFKGRDAEGKIRDGVVDVPGPDQLKDLLEQRGLFLLSFQESKAAKKARTSRVKVAQGQLAFLCWQLYTALDAGIPIVDGIELARRQVRDEELIKILGRVNRDLREGISFSQALSSHPATFSRMFISLVQAGEIASAMPQMMHKLAIYLDKQAERRGRVIAALTYPCVLMGISSLVVAFLLTFVTPRFEAMFQTLGGDLPAPTRVLIASGRLMQVHWWKLLLGAGGLLLGLRVASGTIGGRLAIHRAVLAIPLAGPLLHKLAISRLGDTMATLTGAGVPILQALPIVAGSVGNDAIGKVISDAIEEIKQGKSIGATLGRNPLIPELMAGMIQVGEQTGELGSLMGKVSLYLDREVDQTITRFSKLVEPVLLVALTVVVGGIAMAIFLPLAEITERIGQ